MSLKRSVIYNTAPAESSDWVDFQAVFPPLGDLEQGRFTSLCFYFPMCKMEDSDTYLPCKAV